MPVTHTVEPVNLLDLFGIFNVPTRDRLRVLINELGLGVEGRWDGHQRHPAPREPGVGAARQVISILKSQRAQLATLIQATDTIAGETAGHTAGLQSFLDHAAAASSITAAHGGNLARAIDRLPALLAATGPALGQLDRVAVAGTPLVRQLHAAVPSLNRAETDLGPFVALAKPALRDLGGALHQAVPALHDTAPVLGTLNRYTARSLPSTQLTGKLLVNLQQHGFFENFLSVFYYVAATAARFDSTSHMVPSFLVDLAAGACGAYATKPVPGCDAHYGQVPPFRPGPALSRRTAAAQVPAGVPAPAPFASAGAASGASAGGGVTDSRPSRLIARILAAPNTRAGPGAAALRRLQQVLQGGGSRDGQALQNLVTYLLR